MALYLEHRSEDPLVLDAPRFQLVFHHLPSPQVERVFQRIGCCRKGSETEAKNNGYAEDSFSNHFPPELLIMVIWSLSVQ